MYISNLLVFVCIAGVDRDGLDMSNSR